MFTKKQEEIDYYKEQLSSLKDMMQRSTAYMQKLQLELSEAKEQLETKHHEIIQSVNYAKGIQDRLIPEVETFQTYFSEAQFHLSQQGAIGGDLIYAREREGSLYFGLMDCTGHGIPGALISMMGYSFLDEIVKYGSKKTSGEVMELLNRHFIDFFKSRKNEPKRHDGMDGVFFHYMPSKNLLCYTTVGRPLWLKTAEGWEFIKSDRLSIGGGYNNDFTCHSKTLAPGDELFIFSDGLPDQFGGKRNKKFMTKRVKEILCKNEHLSVNQRLNAMVKEVSNWKKGEEQTDDISFLGLKL
jgi:serine phosphatase RsbU (regulator of sigma subunit)